MQRVAAIPWTGWQLSCGLSGNFAVDWVATFLRTGWQNSVEYAHYLKEEPHALKRVMKRFVDKTDKRLSLSSLKRLAKKARLRWKRVRKSLKSLRDPDAFAQAKRDLEALQQQEDHGQIALYYFDESGVALDPTIP